MAIQALALLMAGLGAGPYQPTWDSVDSRPTPQWFEDAKFGVFIHWGVYAVPSWAPKGKYAEWYWHDMENKDGETWKHHVATYGEKFKYQDFAPMFKAELYNPQEWADILKRSGAKYVVLTSKHHEGFCMWPSAQAWNWNSVDIGPHRDLAGELVDAVKATGLKAGFYYSLYEWYNPLYQSDMPKYVDQHMLPQLKDLVMRYKPDLVWPDGEWDHPSAEWRSAEFLAWLFNESPVKDTVAVNDRWGKETRNTHGGFATPEYGHIPQGRLIDAGLWEECQGMGASFGYNRNESVDEYRSTSQLLALLIDTVSRGGNLLLDIGPTADGRIPVIMQQRLVSMGDWLARNGEAIYGTAKWRETKEGETVRYTTKDGAVYAICLEWPGAELRLAAPKGDAPVVTMLGHEGNLEAKVQDGALVIKTPPLTPEDKHAYVFKLGGVQ
jgi:alpha-L-fucosidase